MTTKKQSEKATEKYLGERARRFGGQSIKLLACNRRGLPDRLILLPGGRVAFVEVKSEGRKPTDLQAETIQTFRALGFIAEVVDTKEAVNGLFARLALV